MALLCPNKVQDCPGDGPLGLGMEEDAAVEFLMLGIGNTGVTVVESAEVGAPLCKGDTSKDKEPMSFAAADLTTENGGPADMASGCDVVASVVDPHIIKVDEVCEDDSQLAGEAVNALILDEEKSDSDSDDSILHYSPRRRSLTTEEVYGIRCSSPLSVRGLFDDEAEEVSDEESEG